MYQIQQGDCLELMKSIPDKSIDMILADLPYGVVDCEWDFILPFNLLWDTYKRIVKNNGCIALFSSQPFTTDLINSNRDMFKYEIIWEKSNATQFLNSSFRPLQSHENILIFYKDKPTYNPQMYKINKLSNKTSLNKNGYGNLYSTTKYEVRQTGGKEERFPRTVLECFSVNSNINVHPTQKPVPLLEYLILTYTNENETILDNTMGSGSTGVACIRTNRKFIGYEKDSNYFSIAERRILEEIDKTSLFNSLGGATR